MKKEARKYFRALVRRTMYLSGKSRRSAEYLVKNNIGYWAGYHDSGTAQRIWRLFECAHPVFGRHIPTPDEAFQAGIDAFKKWQRHYRRKFDDRRNRRSVGQTR